MPETENKFKNPYLGVPEEDQRRINSDIGVDDWNLIRAVRLRGGSLTTTVNILFHRLCHELRTRGITDNSQHDRFEDFVSGCKLVPQDEYDQLVTESAQWRQQQAALGRLDDGSVTRPNRPAKRRAVSGGTKGQGAKVATEPQVGPHVQGDAGTGGGEGGGETKEGG